MTVLFGSILLNDFAKVCIYYFNGLREWWRDEKEQEKNNQREQRFENDKERVEIEMDPVYAEELEERLERVYMRLLEVNSSWRRNYETELENNHATVYSQLQNFN